MNAKEAREIAYKTNTESANSQYNKIIAQIEENANAGKYSTYYYDYILPDVKNKLVMEGFQVGEMTSIMNESSTEIKW